MNSDKEQNAPRLHKMQSAQHPTMYHSDLLPKAPAEEPDGRAFQYIQEDIDAELSDLSEDLARDYECFPSDDDDYMGTSKSKKTDKSNKRLLVSKATIEDIESEDT